jgi:predicted O-methyltransferase YrrM
VQAGQVVGGKLTGSVGYGTRVRRNVGGSRSESGFWEVMGSLDVRPGDTSQVSDADAKLLFRLVDEHGCTSTLEIGCGLGKSAVAIMLGTTGNHTVIDPCQANYGNRGLANIQRAGLSDRLVFVPEYSHAALPRLLDAGERFDFVFVDGSHRFDDVFVDFYYSDLLLSPRGFIVFDDLWMRTVRLVSAYIHANRSDYRFLHKTSRTLAVLQKTGIDARDRMYHREFYTPRGLVSQHAVTWLAEGDSSLKRLARRLKSAVCH